MRRPSAGAALSEGTEDGKLAPLMFRSRQLQGVFGQLRYVIGKGAFVHAGFLRCAQPISSLWSAQSPLRRSIWSRIGAMSDEKQRHRPTIVWLISGHEGYGVRQGVLSLAGEVQALGCPVRILALSEGPFSEECHELGFLVDRLAVGRPPGLNAGFAGKLTGLARLAAYQRRAAIAIAHALQRHKADVLHFRWPTFVVMAGRAARKAQIPCFWQMPNAIGTQYPLGLNRRMYQWACARYRIQPLANSRFTATTLGDRPVKPFVLHLGADATRFDPEKVDSLDRRSLGIADDAVVLTIAARLTAMKGQHLVLRAMLAPELQAHNLHLLLLGGPVDGEFASELRQIARDAGAEHRLHLVGLVADPERYYAVSDVVVNSRIDPEPFGWTVIEAMMMRRPMLVHASGGPAETVIDGETGWHVGAPTQEAFKAGLVRALHARPRWDSMGRAARAHSVAHFSSTSVAVRYLELVQASLAK